MAWIAISDHSEQRFSLSGLGSDAGRASTAQERVTDTSLLTRGSILIEARFSPEGRPQTLLAWKRMHPWVSSFSLQALPGGGVVLVIGQGSDLTHAALPHTIPASGDTMRITYSWDAPARQARLSIETVSDGRISMAQIAAPKPMLLSDLRSVARDPMQRAMDRDVAFFAISTAIEPVGPMPALTTHVPLLTAYGYREAGQIRQGDLLRTMTGTQAPVLDTLRRTVPARGSFRPVRLRAPYFGLQQDIIVAPDQRLVIGGSDVEYMFGHERVLVPARHLVNGTAAMHIHGALTVTYCQMILPGHEAMLAAGTPVESLFIGRLRRKPERLEASLLAGSDRDSLPEHAQSTYPVLRQFEAITLAHKRAA